METSGMACLNTHIFRFNFAFFASCRNFFANQNELDFKALFM